MNVHAKIFVDLSNLPYMLPSLYSPIDKKSVVIDVWQKMIIDGEGFVGNDLGKGLKGYLKDRCVSKKIDNFAIFCRQWCKEILPHLDIKNLTQIDRIYLVFKTLGKEYVEADTHGVRAYREMEIQLKEMCENFITSSLGFPSFIYRLLSSLMDLFFSFSVKLPWWVAAFRSEFSRYRTTRQSLVGLDVVAATLKDRHGGFKIDIENKFKPFKDVQAKIARSFSVEGILSRDNEETLENIKIITSKRLAVLAFRVVCATFCVFSFIFGEFITNSPVKQILAMLVWWTAFCFGYSFHALNHWQGGLEGGTIGVCEIALNIFAGIPGLLWFIYDICSTLVSGHPIWIAYNGVISIIMLFTVMCGTFAREEVNRQLHTAFYSEAPWDEATDRIDFLLSRLSGAIDFGLERFFRLLDGDATAVKA